MSAHARLSPSSCNRWSQCTASVAFIDTLHKSGRIPPRSSSIYAAEGTVAHEVRELCLTFGLQPHHFIGAKLDADGYQFTVDEAMADCLQPGIDWIREHSAKPYVEVRVDLSPWLPGQFGTCDTCWIEIDLITGELILVVNDYKHGQGEPVAAVGTKQLRNYALGAWNFLGKPKVDRVLMVIDQPRAGGMKFWEISLDELLEFGESLKAVYAKIESGDVEFAPSESACRWCEAKLHCAAREKWLLEFVADDYDAFTGDEPLLHDANSLTPRRRWDIVRHAAVIRAWLAQLHEDSLNAALMGRPDPGSKAIEGDLGNRFFVSKEKADAIMHRALGDDAYKPRETITLTEAEKLMKPGKKKQGHPDAWDELLLLVDRPAGKPKLVPEDHAKPALARISADDFDDLD